MTAYEVTVRLVIILLPLLFTPVLASGINNGVLNFGGGEKDIVLLVPWLLWSISYAVAGAVCWRRHLKPARSLMWAILWATAPVLALGFVFAFFGPRLIGIAVPG